MKQGKIYIIEDDETIVKLLKQHLSQTYEVFSVQNFRAIKQEVEEIQPDLILIDITLPYFNGFYWTTEIRKTMTLPIIFISSSDDEMDTVMALNIASRVTGFCQMAQNKFPFRQQKIKFYPFYLNTKIKW